MFDVWFDGESVEPVTMEQLETKLQEAFNLPAGKAAVLVNGKSHRIKRGCSADEAQKLADQFASWGANVRIEGIDDAVGSSAKDEVPPPAANAPASLYSKGTMRTLNHYSPNSQSKMRGFSSDG